MGQSIALSLKRDCNLIILYNLIYRLIDESISKIVISATSNEIYNVGENSLQVKDFFQLLKLYDKDS